MKTNIGGISFTSEWMEYQLLEALFNNKDISKKFNLSWVAGREKDFHEAEKIGAKQTYFVHMSHKIDHHTRQATLPPGMNFAYDGLVLSVA